MARKMAELGKEAVLWSQSLILQSGKRQERFLFWDSAGRNPQKTAKKHSLRHAYLEEYRSDLGTPPSSSGSLILTSDTPFLRPWAIQESHPED